MKPLFLSFLPSMILFGATVSAACPDLSGTYFREDPKRTTERTVVQTGCETLGTRDFWIHKDLPIKSNQDYLADGICRTYTSTEDTEACEAHRFTATAFETTIVNKRWPQVDHEFVAGTIRHTLDATKNLVLTLTFLGPNGENMGTMTEVWTRRN